MTGVLLAVGLFLAVAAVVEVALHLAGDGGEPTCTAPLSHPPRAHEPRRNRP